MRITRRLGWRKRWLTQGFGLGPFAFGNQIERRLRKEISFTEFSQQLHGQLDTVGLTHWLPTGTVSWLYEMMLRARVEKETVILAQRLKTSKAWRNNEKELNNLIAVLKAYPTFDPERMLRNVFGGRKDSRTRRRAAQLFENLWQLKNQLKWWSEYTSWGHWMKKDTKGYQIVIDKHLRKRFPESSKTARGLVIQVAVDAGGLNNKEAAADSILRNLRREAQKRRT